MATTTTTKSTIRPSATVKHTSETQLGPNAIAPRAELVAEDEGDLVFHDLPPFPEDVPTAPLLRISLRKLLDRDSGEIERLWKASCDVGFFYLDLRGGIAADDNAATDDDQINGDGLISDVEALFALGNDVFALPTEEKQKYDFSGQGSYFGYKGLGAGVVDHRGTRDGNEFYNVSKDDILSVGETLPAPALLQNDFNRSLLATYMRRSHAILTLILSLLDEPLELPKGTLENLHRLRQSSGDQVRWVRSPASAAPKDAQTAALGEHTDFGSLTLLFNRLGGLQILPPSAGARWSYVRPLRGHAVCNLGDAMVKFSAGILRSNTHRVVGPPGAQAGEERMSLVYFARPEDEVLLVPLEDESQVIKSKACEKVRFKGGEGEERITAKEWTLRRGLAIRKSQDPEKKAEGGGVGK